MKLFNWYIISKSEMAILQERNIKLRRKLTDKQIEDLLEGKLHIARNPRRRKINVTN